MQPDWSNQSITISLIGQFKPVKWYNITSLSEMISYHFMGIIFIHGFITLISTHRAVFKWLSKVITWLRLLPSVIGLKDSRRFFNQWEAKPNPIAPCMHDFYRASSELQVIVRNCDWFIVLAAPVVIGWSSCFGFGFSTVIWKPL